MKNTPLIGRDLGGGVLPGRGNGMSKGVERKIVWGLFGAKGIAQLSWSRGYEWEKRRGNGGGLGTWKAVENCQPRVTPNPWGDRLRVAF